HSRTTQAPWRIVLSYWNSCGLLLRPVVVSHSPIHFSAAMDFSAEKFAAANLKWDQQLSGPNMAVRPAIAQHTATMVNGYQTRENHDDMEERSHCGEGREEIRGRCLAPVQQCRTFPAWTTQAGYDQRRIYNV